MVRVPGRGRRKHQPVAVSGHEQTRNQPTTNATQAKRSVGGRSRSKVAPVPSLEHYTSQQKCRTPFVCVACANRKLTHSGFAQHLRSKHAGAEQLSGQCNVCELRFDRHAQLTEHVNAAHKVYPCSQCEETFSDLDRLKKHLKSAHDSSYPWVCGFCDLTLFYEIEFQVHVSGHTDRPPFTCPICVSEDAPKTFRDSDLLLAHLSKAHMTRSEHDQMADSKSGRKSGGGGSKNAASSSSSVMAADTTSLRDENAVNREIAALLLNLHASRSGAEVIPLHQQNKAEDLSVKRADAAMDLSKAPKPEVSILPVSISKVKSGGSSDLSKNFPLSSTSAASASAPASISNPYSFYPSLAMAAGLSPTQLSNAGINPNFLLQNFLLEKIQQISAAPSSSTSTSTTSSSALSKSAAFHSASIPSLPNLPASTSIKSVSRTQDLLSLPTSSTSSASNTSASDATGNIPLLCSQIVTQLNGLLFLVHGLKNEEVEMSLQMQLVAIYCRLQEIVTMVEQTKKIEAAAAAAAAAAEKKKARAPSPQLSDEEKLAKHIQSLFMQQTDKIRPDLAANSQLMMAVAAQLKEAAAAAAAKASLSSNLDHSASVDMARLIKKQFAASDADADHALGHRRRGRPPKHSDADGFSPPEKRHRVDSSNGDSKEAVHNGVAHEDLLMHASGVAAASTKGLRNRIFCGECAGCLKNDDCGKCRYCKDKSKFGGQNRLRQKCLHRRCQMETARRRNSNPTPSASAHSAGIGNGSIEAETSSFKDSRSRRSPSPTIYSGVDLARLAAAAAATERKEANEGTSIEQMMDELQDMDDEDLEEGEDSPGNSPKSDADDHVRRSTRNRQKSADSSLKSGHMLSDDDSDDHKSNRSQSRIDKWKSKHRAMLKMAEGTAEDKSKEAEAKEAEAKESSSIKKKRKSTEEGDEGEEDDEKDEDLPDLDAADVCIDLEDGAGRKGKRRHLVRQQVQQQQPQVLIV